MRRENGASRRDVLRGGAAGVGALMGAIGVSSLVGEEEVAAAAAAVGGSVKYFLKFSAIDGESTDARHPKWIDIVSFSWGVTAPIAFGAGGIGVGKAEAATMGFHSLVSSASPKILRALVSGTRFTNAVLAGTSAAGDFLRITMNHVVVNSYKPAGTDLHWPTESFTVAFDEIIVSYRPQLSTGGLGTAITVDWNIATNVVV